MNRIFLAAVCLALGSSLPATCLSVSQTYSTGLSPRGLAVADFNSDGFADVAVANFGSPALLGRPGSGASGSISVFWGSSQGLFAGPVLSLPNDAPRGLASADFGQGPVLLATLYDSGRLAVYPRVTDRSFAAPSFYAVGQEPVAVSSASFQGKTWVAVADFGGDTVHLFNASQNGTLTLAGILTGFHSPTDVRFYAPAKAKSLLLLVTDYRSNALSRVSLNPDGSPAAVTVTALAGGPGRLALGDLNGDGLPDLAVACFLSNSLDVFWGQSDGSLGLEPTSLALQGRHPNGLAFGTVCGVPSFLAADRDSDAVEVVSGQAGSLSSTVLSLVSSESGTASSYGPVDLGFGAFSGAGQNDVVASEMGAKQLVLLEASSLSAGASENPAFALKLSPTVTVNAPGLVLAPNPAFGQVRVFYQVNQPGQTDLLLYNLLGQRVKSLGLGYLEPGAYQTELALSELGSGVYYAVLTQNNPEGRPGVVARFKLALIHG